MVKRFSKRARDAAEVGGAWGENIALPQDYETIHTLAECVECRCPFVGMGVTNDRAVYSCLKPGKTLT